MLEAYNNSAILAVSTKTNPSRFTKTIGLNDFYWGAPDFDYPLGHVQPLGKSLPPELAGRAPGAGIGPEQTCIAVHPFCPGRHQVLTEPRHHQGMPFHATLRPAPDKLCARTEENLQRVGKH